MWIKYEYQGQMFYEDQSGCSRSLIDTCIRAEEVGGVVVDDDDNIIYDGRE